MRYAISLSLLMLVSVAICSAWYVRAQSTVSSAAVMKVPELTQACWGEGADRQCVPLSILKATFQGWQPGSAPPVNQARQELITVQAQFVETLKNFRQCEGMLGPLQATAHQTSLQQQQQQLTDDNNKAAPPGMRWDASTNKYVAAPPPEKKKDGGQ